MIQSIDQDLKQAQKDKNEIVLSSLRNLKAEIKNTEISKGKTLSEQDLADVVRKKVKQHRDSIESFKQGSRADLVDNEQKQMEVLLKYLPKQMDEDQVRALVLETIKELNAQVSDFGKVMKAVMAKAKGQTDGTTVSKILKEMLG